MKNLLDVDPNEDYEILRISEELKKDNNVIDFLQNQMLPETIFLFLIQTSIQLLSVLQSIFWLISTLLREYLVDSIYDYTEIFIIDL